MIDENILSETGHKLLVQDIAGIAARKKKKEEEDIIVMDTKLKIIEILKVKFQPIVLFL